MLYLILQFFYLAFILAFGITISNVINKAIDYGLYRYFNRKMQQSIRDEVSKYQANLLHEAEPGTAIPMGGLN